jgi:hypothetical protein
MSGRRKGNLPKHRDDNSDNISWVKSFLKIDEEEEGRGRREGQTLKRVNPRMRIKIVFKCPRT